MGHTHRLSRVTAAVPISYYLVEQTVSMEAGRGALRALRIPGSDSLEEEARGKCSTRTLASSGRRARVEFPHQEWTTANFAFS